MSINEQEVKKEVKIKLKTPEEHKTEREKFTEGWFEQIV